MDQARQRPGSFSADIAENMQRRLGRDARPNVPLERLVYLERLGSARYMLLGWGISDEVLRAASNLELVSFTGIGAGNFVNLQLARELGITVCNTPGYADVTVAEHTFALLLGVVAYYGVDG